MSVWKWSKNGQFSDQILLGYPRKSKHHTVRLEGDWICLRTGMSNVDCHKGPVKPQFSLYRPYFYRMNQLVWLIWEIYFLLSSGWLKFLCSSLVNLWCLPGLGTYLAQLLYQLTQPALTDPVPPLFSQSLWLRLRFRLVKLFYFWTQRLRLMLNTHWVKIRRFYNHTGIKIVQLISKKQLPILSIQMELNI